MKKLLASFLILVVGVCAIGYVVYLQQPRKEVPVSVSIPVETVLSPAKPEVALPTVQVTSTESPKRLLPAPTKPSSNPSGSSSSQTLTLFEGTTEALLSRALPSRGSRGVSLQGVPPTEESVPQGPGPAVDFLIDMNYH